jgi:hypothetical protein
MWPAYPGGEILVVRVGLRQLPVRLDELLASGQAATTSEARVPK